MESQVNNTPAPLGVELPLLRDSALEVEASDRSHTHSIASSTADPSWQERNLLSLDGGGIRGYWSLLVLKKLMEAIAEAEQAAVEDFNSTLPRESPLRQGRLDSFWPLDCPPDLSHVTDPNNPQAPLREDQRFLPVHYFDTICGSSTGGLIAIMLGRFRMTVADCLQEYETLGQRVFGKPRWVSQRNLPIVPWPKYSAHSLEKVFKDVTQRRCEFDARGEHSFNAPTFPTMEGTCNVFVTAVRKSTSRKGPEGRIKYIIRSYNNGMTSLAKTGTSLTRPVLNYGSGEAMKIWQVARAATAAPLYFRALKMDNPHARDGMKYHFSDGGFGAENNPCYNGIQELESLHGHEGDNNGSVVGVVVSVGTAKAKNSPGGVNLFFDTVRGLTEEATSANIYAKVLNDQNRKNYWRFNDEEGVQVELDEWEPHGWFTPSEKSGTSTLEKLTHAFNAWALVRENRKAIEACATELVARRRARTNNASLWEQYATGAGRFQCRHPNCSREFYTFRDEFEAHFAKKHKKRPNASDYCDPRFRCWRYPPKEA